MYNCVVTCNVRVHYLITIFRSIAREAYIPIANSSHDQHIDELTIKNIKQSQTLTWHEKFRSHLIFLTTETESSAQMNDILRHIININFEYMVLRSTLFCTFLLAQNINVLNTLRYTVLKKRKSSLFTAELSQQNIPVPKDDLFSVSRR